LQLFESITSYSLLQALRFVFLSALVLATFQDYQTSALFASRLVSIKTALLATF
jgi:hypothetical protein